MRIGVIGCGMVSHAYLGTIVRAPDLELKALASRTMRSAEAQAARYGGVAVSVDAMLGDPDIDLVVVLAPPGVHHALGRSVLEAGKHLYLEKPLATTLDDAADLIALAKACGLAIGCAPDTFLGPGHQTVRRMVDDDAIGRITGGAVAFGTHGMESWHPDPAFFYAIGGGPLLDVGPYYVTQLVNLLGPVVAVTAIGTMPRVERMGASPTCAGKTISVEVPTTINGALLFENGANVSIALSWDVVAHGRPVVELYGEQGSIAAPDPNQFDGTLRTANEGGTWSSVGIEVGRPVLSDTMLAAAVAAMGCGIDPVTGGPIGPDTALRFGDRRGLGLLDLAEAIVNGRTPRASGALAYHVLEVLLGLERSVAEGHHVAIHSCPERPPVVAASIAYLRR